MKLVVVGRGLIAVMSLCLAVAGLWMVLNLYTGPWASFVRPTREFLSAALAGDTARLTRLSTSGSLVRLALRTAAVHPEQFASIKELRVIGGRRAGDTTWVTFAHSGCADNFLALTFRGTGAHTQIKDINLPCGSP